MFQILGKDCFEFEHAGFKHKFLLMCDSVSGYVMLECHSVNHMTRLWALPDLSLVVLAASGEGLYRIGQNIAMRHC